MTASKFSRSHAVALWNILRTWWVLFLQDTWTRSQCGFYYYGLGNEVTKQLCLPRWLASNQSYDSWSKAPCCIFPFWGERCKYVSIKVSIPVLGKVTVCTQTVIDWWRSCPSQIKHHISCHLIGPQYVYSHLQHEQNQSWQCPFPLSSVYYSSMDFRRVIIQLWGWSSSPCLFNMLYNPNKSDFKHDSLDPQTVLFILTHTGNLVYL